MAGAVAGVMRPEASVMARPPMRRTASASISGPMLSSSTASTPLAQRLVELVERIDLDLDLDQMPDAGARGADGRRHAAGRGDMVVLDQHGVIEAEAVVDAAARAHRVFLQGAQAGHGLARAADARLVALHRLDQRRPSRWRRRSDGPGN